MARKQDPVNKEGLYKDIIVNGNHVTIAFCKYCCCSLVKNTCRQKHYLVLCEKAPIDIREYYDIQKSSTHKKFTAETKKRMKKKSCKRGSGVESEDALIPTVLIKVALIKFQYFQTLCMEHHRFPVLLGLLFRLPVFVQVPNPSSLWNQSGAATKIYVYPKSDHRTTRSMRQSLGS